MAKFENVFYGRSVLACKDFTPNELRYMIDLALHLKELKKQNIPHHYLEGKNIALLFEKTSTRTRSSFVVASHDLGANPEYMDSTGTQFGKKESVEDTAKVLGSMFDGIEFRGYKQSTVEGLAEFSGVPVWNGLTDEWHPTQMLADFMTMKEKFGHIKGLTLAFVGDGRNNMANSLLVAGTMLGVNVHIVTPSALHTDEKIVDIANCFAKETGAKPVVTDNIAEGVKGANVIYTDVWVSMGEHDWEDRVKLLKPYEVNMDLMKMTGTPDDELIFMHCLPSFHDLNTTQGKEIFEKYGLKNMEVTDEVFRSKYAWQFIEAENRMHSIKAMMAVTLAPLYIPAYAVNGCNE